MTGWIEKSRSAARLGVAKAMAGQALRACRDRPIILVYHRVVGDGDAALYDEPGMAVALDTFDGQMAFMCEHFAPRGLREIADAVARGRALSAGVFTVTFDDGWADAANALPILRRWGIQATMFASASHLESDGEFWTRRFLRILSSAENGHDGLLKSWPGQARTAALARLGWRRLDANPALGWLAGLPAHAREQALDEFAAECGVASESPSRDLMTVEDLRAWLSAGMEVGSHGYDHGCLTNSDGSALEREVAQSKALLQETLGVDVAGFAYPYGEVNGAVRAAVAQAGYGYGCALDRPRNEPLDVFMLPRRPVHEGVAAGPKGGLSKDLLICYLAGVFARRRR